MSHPARGPIGTMGIDGKAIAAGRRRRGRVHGMSLTEAAE
jgi:hypothetical protein